MIIALKTLRREWNYNAGHNLEDCEGQPKGDDEEQNEQISSVLLRFGLYHFDSTGTIHTTAEYSRMERTKQAYRVFRQCIFLKDLAIRKMKPSCFEALVTM